MVSPQLSRLKIRVDHLVIALGGVILVVGALLTWRARTPDAADSRLDAQLERMQDRERAGARERPPRILRPLFQSSSEEVERDPPGLRLTPPPNSEAVGPEEAVVDFRQVMTELEDALESGRKLSTDEEAELYNRASGSFTAMSAWIDADDVEERALMDDAYLQMRSLMRELKIEPPAHDPDYNPLRR